jgi:hypothetical protein
LSIIHKDCLLTKAVFISFLEGNQFKNIFL